MTALALSDSNPAGYIRDHRPTDISAEVRKRLRELRTERGYRSAAHLATACRDRGATWVTDNVIENLERDHRNRSVTVDELFALADVLGVSPLSLLPTASRELQPVLPQLDAAVLYTLDEADAEKITAWRENFAAFNAGMSGHKHPHRPGTPGSTGHVAHVGSPVRAGDVRPARVTAVPDPESGRLNLKVSLDGSDFYWAAGVPPGDGPGQWTDLP